MTYENKIKTSVVPCGTRIKIESWGNETPSTGFAGVYLWSTIGRSSCWRRLTDNKQVDFFRTYPAGIYLTVA
jgi:hypothetical protein